MARELTDHTAHELAVLLTDGTVSAREVTDAHLERIATFDGVDTSSGVWHRDDNTGSNDTAIHAFLHVLADAARDTADEIDAKRARGETLPAFAGVPVAIKDVLTWPGSPTTCGSRMLANWNPPYQATVVTRLIDAGLIPLGTTNMDEFAMGSSTENSAFGPTRNPFDVACVPGGSSGGSAAAVAARFAPFSVGTDTGGSIRQPAAFTGIVGTKPTYGTVSRYGLVAFASSLDQAGPFARTVADTAALHDIMRGHDPRDSTSITQAAPAFPAATTDLSGVTIGVISELVTDGFSPDVLARFNDTCQALSSRGATLIDVSLPHAPYGLAAYYLIAPSEASSNLARFDGVRYGLRVDADTAEEMNAHTRSEGFGTEVKRRIMIGTHALSSGYYDAYYLQASKVRTLIARDFSNAFTHVDALLSPTTPSTAFRFGEKTADPIAMYLSDVATVPASLAGIPAMSLPIGIGDDGMPVGVQIMAPLLRDDVLYRVAYAIEQTPLIPTGPRAVAEVNA
ncbi:MAG: Asp-tRNA(Asn)/Glu-tRNA(Gln) amidotransferase subunit GatA [Nitriliruptoraceae bacterium]